MRNLGRRAARKSNDIARVPLPARGQAEGEFPFEPDKCLTSEDQEAILGNLVEDDPAVIERKTFDAKALPRKLVTTDFSRKN